MRVSRRRLLSGLGAGTVALLGRPLLRDCFAQPKAAKRLVLLYMPNCNIKANWTPTGGRSPEGNSGDAKTFTFKSGNDTLTPVRDQTTILTGIDLKSIGGDPHGSGIIRLVTGGTIRAGEKARDPGAGTLGNGNLPMLPSIDQVLIGKSAALQGTPIPALHFACDTRADDGRTDIHMRVMSYDTKPMPVPVPPDIEPVKTYNRLFGNIMTGGGAPPDMATTDRLLREQKSVLDYINGDLARLNQRLPAAQKDKLARHLDGLREIERSLSGTSGAAAGPVKLPGVPEDVKPNVSANHKKIVDQYFAITKLAFQLDISRVVTTMFGSANSQVSIGDFLPGGAKGGLHPMAHSYKTAQLTAATSWYCGTVAAWVKDLGATPDMDGTPMLDNTIIMFASEVSQYHEHENIPLALFGGKNLGLQGGRCLNYNSRTPSDMWVGVAKAFGVEMATFGDAQYNKGALPELFA
jgi:hypothetical protein